MGTVRSAQLPNQQQPVLCLFPQSVTLPCHPISIVGDPKQTTHALADAAESLGARVIDGESVNSVFIHTQPSGDESSCPRYSLHTSAGRVITADSVVVACGAWASFLQGGGFCQDEFKRRVNFHVPVYPAKGTIWSTEVAPHGFLQKVVFIAESGWMWKHWSSRDDGNNSSTSKTSAALLPIPEFCTHDRNMNRHVRHT